MTHILRKCLLMARRARHAVSRHTKRSVVGGFTDEQWAIDGRSHTCPHVAYTPFTRSSKHRAIIEQTSSKFIQNTRARRLLDVLDVCLMFARCLLDDCLIV